MKERKSVQFLVSVWHIFWLIPTVLMFGFLVICVFCGWGSKEAQKMLGTLKIEKVE